MEGGDSDRKGLTRIEVAGLGCELELNKPQPQHRGGAGMRGGGAGPVRRTVLLAFSAAAAAAAASAVALSRPARASAAASRAASASLRSSANFADLLLSFLWYYKLSVRCPWPKSQQGLNNDQRLNNSLYNGQNLAMQPTCDSQRPPASAPPPQRGAPTPPAPAPRPSASPAPRRGSRSLDAAADATSIWHATSALAPQLSNAESGRQHRLASARAAGLPVSNTPS